MRRESKSTTGSVVKDKRSQKWQFFWWTSGRRYSKTLGRFATKTAAWNAAQVFRAKLPQPQPSSAPTVAALVEQYRAEKMPKRYSTRRSYNAWLRNHVVPKFGTCPLSDVQARPAELWLESLSLTPRSRAAVRGLLRILWEYAMWRGDMPTQRNPMELVTIKGASKRTSKPRSLTVEEFQRFARHLGEPFHTIALVCVCFGLRISEALALRWSDVDWLRGKLSVQRGIVRQHVDDVKTDDFATLKWPHFDHYIWPHPNRKIGLPCLRSGRGGRWTGDARWSYSKRSGGNMCMELVRFVRSRRNWGCIGEWCDRPWLVRFRRSAKWRRETSRGWVR